MLDPRGHRWTSEPIGGSASGAETIEHEYTPEAGDRISSIELGFNPAGAVTSISIDSGRKNLLGADSPHRRHKVELADPCSVFAGLYCTFGPHPDAGCVLTNLHLLHRVPGPHSLEHLPADWVSPNTGKSLRLEHDGHHLLLHHPSRAVEVYRYAGPIDPLEALGSLFRNTESGEILRLFGDIAGQEPRIELSRNRGTYVSAPASH